MPDQARPSSDTPEPSVVPPVDAFKSAGRHFAEFKAFAAHYFAAKADAAKLSVRKIILAVLLGAVAGVAGIAMLATAAVLVLVGLANAIGAAFDPPKPWVGQLIVGVVVLLGTMGAVVLMVRKITGASRARTVAKYESKHVQERRQFGHDIRQTEPATAI
jgi:hypothetical protein